MTLKEAADKIVDAHAHLCDELFDKDLGGVLLKASASGVAAVIAVGENLADAEKNMKLADFYPLLRVAAGLYPTILDPALAEEMITFIRENRSRLVAIGEVGLDYWAVKEEADRELQRRIFLDFVDLSLELDLPLNIHSRSAGRHVIDLLLERGAVRVLLHAFDGKASSAFPAVEAGYFFSVPPSIIRSRQKQKLVKNLPLSSLLVESDSPVLGPSAHERNEPVHVITAVDAIAGIKNLNRGEVMEAVLENTLHLFGDLNI